MATKIPDELKADVPLTPWGKVLTATPIIMTVIATLLAGLSSSEMTRAQYDRSLAAQQQSKAGDQWGFFQAKRLRGAVQHNAIDILRATVDVRPFNAAQVKTFLEGLSVPPGPAGAEPTAREAAAMLNSAAVQQALAVLATGALPPLETRVLVPDANLDAALEAVERMAPEAEIVAALAALDDRVILTALRAGRDQTRELDALLKPVNQTIDQLEERLSAQVAALAATGGPDAVQARALHRDFTAARLRYTASRYEIEARMNQRVANLTELQVRKSNITAERHHTRSQRFFFGMLGAQMAVIISTFAVAARKRNILWSLAATAGLAAVSFAVYVYVFL